jgi:hypothetical protein
MTRRFEPQLRMRHLAGVLWESDVITAGEDRLRLLHRSSKSEVKGWYFHSLVWEHLEGENWVLRRELSQEEFQGSHTHKRWVSRIHSLNPQNGSRILKIAEFDQPQEARAKLVVYTWRSWNLVTNREVAVLQQCIEPFDAYDG